MHKKEILSLIKDIFSRIEKSCRKNARKTISCRKNALNHKLLKSCSKSQNLPKSCRATGVKAYNNPNPITGQEVIISIFLILVKSS